MFGPTPWGRNMPKSRKIGARFLLSFLAFATHGVMRSQGSAPGSELIVFCDVSASLKPEAIKAEPDLIFRFIANNTWFPQGTFTVYIADRDVERQYMVSGEKKPSGRDEQNLIQAAQLRAKCEELKKKLAEYCTQNPPLARNKTCLVKAIRVAPHLFNEKTPNGNRRILIMSDMLEDCYAQGDPKTPVELKTRIDRSLSQYQLASLNGLGVYAAILPSSSDRIEIDDLRTIWGSTLQAAHAALTLEPSNKPLSK